MNTEEGMKVKQEEPEILALLNQLALSEDQVVKTVERLKEKVNSVTNFYPRPEADVPGDVPERTTEIGSILQTRVNNLCHIRDTLVDLTERIEL